MQAAVAVQVAGSCNAILRRPDGSLYGDLFDDIGFVRAAKRKRFEFVSDRRCPPLPRNEILTPRGCRFGAGGR